MARPSATSSTEFEPQDGFEIAFKRFPETQMAQLYSQRREGRFCDAIVKCSDGDFKAHRCILATLCTRDLSKSISLPVKMEGLKRLANLCYTGYLKVNLENLEQDIKVAKALKCEIVLEQVQKWVVGNVKQISSDEKVLKYLDADMVKGCLNRLKYMDENWQEFLTQWARSSPNRQKELVKLQQQVEKYAFVSIYRLAVVGGKAMRFDGNNVVDANWLIPQNDRVTIIDIKKKRRVNIASDGTLSLYVEDKIKMTHSHRAIGIHESVRPVIIWLNDGSLLKVVDKEDPFEELTDDERELYQGPAWKKAPMQNACADLHLIPEYGAILHYPGHGTCFLAQRTPSGFHQWTPLPCTDIHYAYTDGKRSLLVSRDVNTYTLISGEAFHTISTIIRGNPRQSPFVIPALCQGNRIMVAIVDLEKTPKTFYFVQYEGGRSRVLSESFDASPEAQFVVM